MTQNSATPTITAGWGDYDGPPAGMALNSSRITTYLRCPERAYRSYIADRVPVERPQTALELGSEWHRVTEAVTRGVTTSVAVEQSVRRLEIAAFNAEADGHLAFAQEARKFAEFVTHAIPLYTEQRAEYDPTGETVAAEQDFWVRIGNLVLRGRFDKVGLLDGLLVNGERKTISDKEDIGDFLALRRNDVQHNLYEIALTYADHSALGLDPDTRPYGTVYDLARKGDYPKVASKNGTVEERRAEWAATRFHTQTMPLSPRHQAETVNTIMYAALAWGNRVKNLGNCRMFTNRMCPHFDACLNGVEGPMQDRTPDYVDEVCGGE